MLQIITILKESLWSAAASRLLYLELIGVALGLIALLPIGYVEQVNFQVTPQDVSSSSRLAQLFMQAGEGRDDLTLVKQMWDQLEDEDQETVKSIAEFDANKRGAGDPGRGQNRKLAKVLNGLIEEVAIEDFDGVEESISLSETRELYAEKDSLGEDKQKRLRRLLVQESLRGTIRPPVASTVAVYYAFYGPFNLPGMSHSGLETQVRSWTPYILDKVFLTVGILIAILITASLIPQMLEEGSLYLQLSKPIPRWLLLVTKYLGSGILIFAISASLLTGLWLILGLRMDMWINELLWFIPLAVALYLIYYSVTVGVGLLFRNAIIAILATVIFGSICYALSVTVWFSGELLSMQRRSKVLQMDDKTFTYDSFGKMHLLQPDQQWEWVYFEQKRPMQDFEVGMMSSFYVSPNIPEAFYLPELNLVVGEMSDISTQQDRSTFFAVAKLDDPEMLRNPINFGAAPEGLVGFARMQSGDLLGISKYGSVWQLSDEGMGKINQVADGTITKSQQPDATVSDPKTDDGVETELAANDLPWNLLGVINESGPDSASRFAYDSQEDVFWAIGRQSITRAQRNENGEFEIKQTFQIPWNWSLTNRTPIAKSGDKLVVPLRQGPVVVLNADTLELVAEMAVPFKNVPVAAASNNGKVAIAYLTDGVWLFDATTNELEKVPNSGMILSVDFDDEDQLVVVRDVDRLQWLDPETGDVNKSIQPTRSSLRWIYEVIVKPLHSGLPKPSECYSLVESLATAEDSDQAAKADGPENQSISVDTLTANASDPWNPLLSSCAFAIVVMALNCFYFSRQQF